MSGVRRVGRALVAVVVVFCALWLSASFTVRLPLAIPILFICIILGLVATMFRRPPPGLFPDTGQEPPPAQASTAIPMPPVTEPPAAADAWAFDEPAEEGW